MNQKHIIQAVKQCIVDALNQSESRDFERGVRHVINELALTARQDEHTKLADILTELALRR